MSGKPRDTVHDGNPLPPVAIEMHDFASLNAKWQSLPDKVRSGARQWVNQWAAVNGGFQVMTAADGEMIVEPARVADTAEGRGTRREVQRLMEKLKAKPALAEAVQISTLLAWHQSRTAKEAGATLQ